MTYRSLVKERHTSLIFILVYLIIFSYVQAISFLNANRTIWCFYSLTTANYLIFAIFSKRYIQWRIGMLLAATGFFFWALSLVYSEGFPAWADILTYGSFSCTLFLIATTVDDPRALKRLKEAVT